MLVIIVVWDIVLSFFLFWVFNLFSKLTAKTDKGNLIDALRKVFSIEEENASEISSLRKNIENILEEDKYHLQKVGLVRFNPFKEMGGDHSFSLSLLNGNNDGIILTGLHSRERTRVYIKKIVSGKSNLELSKEEKKSYLMALKNEGFK